MSESIGSSSGNVSPNLLSLQSPTLNITEASRDGVINVLFRLDPKIVDWVFNTFYDSYIENRGTEERPIINSVANSTYYECPICGQRKNKDASLLPQSFLSCSGTVKESHETAATIPLDWRPILKKAGLRYILGQVNSTLNTNIQTGNLSGSDQDAKKNMSLEGRLRYLAWYQSYSMVAVIVGYPSLYVADWVVKEKKLHQIFSMGFCTNFIIDMSNNILSAMTKGKNMATVSKVLETKVSTESNTHHNIEYDYPAGYAMAQKKSIGEKLGNIFGGSY